MTAPERLGDFWTIWRKWNAKDSTHSHSHTDLVLSLNDRRICAARRQSQNQGEPDKDKMGYWLATCTVVRQIES